MKAGVPVEAEPEAERVLQEIPPAALGRVLTAIREWLSEVPATSIKIRHFVDPEDEGWEEAVVEVHLVSDSGTALTLWDDLGGRITETRWRPSRSRRASGGEYKQGVIDKQGKIRHIDVMAPVQIPDEAATLACARSL